MDPKIVEQGRRVRNGRPAIQVLHEQMIRSMTEAVKKSEEWSARTTALGIRYADPTDLRIQKRDDLALKDLLAAYNWHRDHANFCANMIRMLMDREVTDAIQGR